MNLKVVELREDGQLVIRFPYHPTLVDVVRGLSRRSFDKLNKWWCAPADVVVEVVDTLLPHGFDVAASARAAYAARGGTRALAGAPAESESAPAAAPAPATERPNALAATLFAPIAERAASPATAASAAPPAAARPDSWTISALNARVQQVLRGAFPERLWVVGEIAGFDRNRHRPHVWFELVERDEVAGGAESGGAAGAGAGAGATRAKVAAVLFAATRREVEKQLAASDAPFELKDGLEVRVAVRVELYPPSGAYQLVVEEVDPVHTQGRLAQDRARVLAELERRGLRQRNAERPWPQVPLRVGLITSAGSDAYNDFVNELTRSGYAFAITVADARVQGAGLERGIVAALAWFGARAEGYDVVAIVRGGGARSDLMGFDALPVALAVATAPLKVVSGIGHQRDVSVVDLIAHSEKTPTAAAAAIVARVAEYEQRLADGAAELRTTLATLLPGERDRLRQLAQELAAGAARASRAARERLAAARGRLAPALQGGLRGERGRLHDARLRLLQGTRAQARLRGQLLAKLAERFSSQRFALALQRRGGRLVDLAARAAALHPQATLRRGFALIRDADGRTVRDAGALAAGARIAATVARGRIEATVVKSERDGTANEERR